MSNKISKDELIDELHRLHQELRGVPTQREMNQRGAYAEHTYRNHFGSWNNALQAAGLPINQTNTTFSVERDTLIEELQSIRNKVGGVPTQQELTEHGGYPPHVYRHRFGSWNNALNEANISTREGQNRISTDALIEEIRIFYMAFERPPTTTEIQEAGEYSYQTYLKRFGSFENALTEAGIDPHPNKETFTREQLIEALQSVTEEIGHAPSSKEFKEQRDISLSAYYNEFGSWTDALKESNVHPTTN